MDFKGDKVSKAELLEHLKDLLKEATLQDKRAGADTNESWYYSGKMEVLRELIDDLEYY